MSAYFVLQVEWASEEAKREYVQLLGSLIEKHGGEFIVASREYRVAEGKWRPGLFILIRFPTLGALTGWYDSEEYRRAREYRIAHSVSDALIVEGL